jgi:hypothetical protein
MANIKKWLEDAVLEYGEPIEAIVVGRHYGLRWDEGLKLDNENIVLSVEEGLSKLDQEFDDGFGGADCFPMYAWTKTRVFFIGEYDGSTELEWVPRHPIAIAPTFSGNA